MKETAMLNLLLPPRVDNAYRGSRLALWLFALLLFLKLVMSVNSIFNGYSVATSADGIPLDTFPPAGAQAFVSLFAILGLSNFIICLLGLVVLVRYRGLIPFMFALLLFEHLGRKLIFYFLPIVRTGTSSASYINLILLALMIAGLALSLRNRVALQVQELPSR